MTSWEFAVVAYSEQYFLEDKNLQQKSLDVIWKDSKSLTSNGYVLEADDATYNT